jgi:hypothetical protein
MSWCEEDMFHNRKGTTTMRKLAFDEIVGHDRRGRILPHPAALAMDAAASQPRRVGRDEEPGGAFTAEELLDDLHKDVRDLPPEEHDALLDGLAELVNGGDVYQWAAEDRGRGRRARDRRVGRDQPPAFRGSPVTGGAPIGLPPDRGGEDRRRRVAADAADKLPTRDELWPSAAAKSKGGLPTFEQLFPGAARRG